MQNAVNYFTAYDMHKPGKINFISDYDLSNFTSNFFGMGFRIAPPKGVFSIQKLNAVELRYWYCARSTGLNSNVISLHLKFKP
ncbi:MAG TPA: hypothetical protein VN958_19025 [Chitinophagaceae bacterium]|nr:hypothetical protein [Chitinophagaceae bacterium]